MDKRMMGSKYEATTGTGRSWYYGSGTHEQRRQQDVQRLERRTREAGSEVETGANAKEAG